MKTKTKKLIVSIENYLIEKYGKVSPEWQLSLQMLQDNIDLYKECQKNIEQYGIYDPNTGRKHPLISTMKDLQAVILKIVQQFGLSPWSASKILDSDADSETDFIDSLVSE